MHFHSIRRHVFSASVLSSQLCGGSNTIFIVFLRAFNLCSRPMEPTVNRLPLFNDAVVDAVDPYTEISSSPPLPSSSSYFSVQHDDSAFTSTRPLPIIHYLILADTSQKKVYTGYGTDAGLWSLVHFLLNIN